VHADCAVGISGVGWVGNAVDGRANSHPLLDRGCEDVDPGCTGGTAEKCPWWELLRVAGRIGETLPVAGNLDISRCHCQWTLPDCLRMTGALLEEVYLDSETMRLTVSEGLLGCQGGFPGISRSVPLGVYLDTACRRW
jgi:hypothetical protein